MMRRGIRRVLPKRDRWHSLQEYALGEKNQEEFRMLRARDGAVSALVGGSGGAAPKPIDWSEWEAKISNKQVLECLKAFHSQQSALLDSVIAEDHAAATQGQKAGWELFDAATTSCAKSVEKSEDILRNGARALWISFQNPSISLLSQSEWLDTDQYWQAFVEKHHFYHNHLCSAVEDPESKEYDAKQKAELKLKWEKFDGRGTTRQNNKLLYQRPSFEYYDLFRGPLVEHMIFYLSKTGGDARMFPETMPVQWYAEIYSLRFKIYNVLQRRKSKEHMSTLAREMHHDFHPHDLEHDGEAHFAKLIARESAVTELMAGRLMGNYILFSDDYVPVQTGMAMYRALQMDGGKGTFYCLGSDVHCLFYKPAEALATPDPTECFHALADHAAMTGRRFEVGYAAAMEAFCEVLESRKEGLGGCWFAAPGEPSRDAFMRRLKRSDPAYAIYEAYAAEHAERWEGAKALSMDEALAEMPEIERKYKLECQEYDNVLLGVSDELAGAAKLEQEQLAKLADGEKLQAQLDTGAFVAVEAGVQVKDAAAVARSVHEFDSQREKAVDSIMNLKVALGAKK
eukprot:CAMPEP_0204561530 /NCGR_PEP_ID=MMETSP0661-20131031/33233_1 /ASSEMBLY_ACC=CAM_ASM_000606 /TAXON_ID=109239 /ORGANISM="Alexandrium margalefi, Strain AMGDE01CS-322" /LENGTH=569 /DNA_ID=CAMNT_0051568947 /DNA_START=65 /DNA_END=1774 /DNA_ORIENTATION=-